MEKYTNKTIGRRLKFRYMINDEYHLSSYPVLAKEDQEIIKDVVLLISEYNINNWSVEFSNPFIIEDRFVYNKEFVKEDISRKIEETINREMGLKLTK